MSAWPTISAAVIVLVTEMVTWEMGLSSWPLFTLRVPRTASTWGWGGEGGGGREGGNVRLFNCRSLTHRQTDRQTGNLIDRETDRQENGWMEEQRDGQTDG